MGQNRINPEKVQLILRAVLVFLILLFIFSNSLQNGEESNERSGKVMELLRMLLDPHERVAAEQFHWFVRKAAHFTEFAALGSSLWLLMQSVQKLVCFSYLSVPFISLLTAVTDEYIQSFTGRTSSVQDVLIDFSGALAGLFAAYIIGKIRGRRNAGKKCRTEK